MTKRFNKHPTFDHQEYLGESGDLWNEAELRRTVALLADLLEGQETAYQKYTPAQFRHRLRTRWISERESMNRLMEKNIELQKEQEIELRLGSDRDRWIEKLKELDR